MNTLTKYVLWWFVFFWFVTLAVFAMLLSSCTLDKPSQNYNPTLPYQLVPMPETIK